MRDPISTPDRQRDGILRREKAVKNEDASDFFSSADFCIAGRYRNSMYGGSALVGTQRTYY